MPTDPSSPTPASQPNGSPRRVTDVKAVRVKTHTAHHPAAPTQGAQAVPITAAQPAPEPVAPPPEPTPDGSTTAIFPATLPGEEGDGSTKGKKDKKDKKPRSRKRKIIEIVILVLILAGGAGAWWWYHRPATVHLAKVIKINPKKPTVYYSPLTGLPTTQAGTQQPVVGVMIENLDPDARPQSGLSSAGVVYEALAEGGITRFLAIFQEPLPSVIGPVRSLRPYYLDWGLEYNIPVAHAGGSIPALAEIVPLGLKNINALEYDGSYFYRTTTRLAPHNLYTSNTLLTQLVSKLGFATAPTFTPLPRTTGGKALNPAPHPTININFSYADYAVQYNFDATTNSYARVLAGTPHIDANTNQQIYVKNIIVEYVPTTYSTQADGDPETDMNLIGTGQAQVFENGGEENATWSKASNSAQTKITDRTTGKPIKFNPGNTWYEILPIGNTVSF